MEHTDAAPPDQATERPMKRQASHSSATRDGVRPDLKRAAAADDQGYKTHGNMYSDGKNKKSRQRDRRRADNASKIRSGDRHKAEQVVTAADMTNPCSTKTGWSGMDYKRRPEAKQLTQDWLDRKIYKIMVDDYEFTLVRYERSPTLLLDRNGVAFAFRSNIPDWMTTPDENGRTWLDHFEEECMWYIDKCGPRKDADIEANNRGDHWYMVVGVDRQNKKSPDLTSFHKAHRQATDELLQKPCTARLIKFVSTTFETRFPSLAQRVSDCETKLREQDRGEHATPLFGKFYNYCINGPRKGVVDGVSTGPHVDGKNLALMMCAVFVWGKFDHTEKAWLVLWEAKLIIELPPGVLMYYPSSLFTHFNVDPSDLKIVTTSDGSRPTPENSSPLKGVPGRGSVVFFNQATMFQLAEKGSSVKDARARVISPVA
ncbi:hypothetical protein OH76DRAFT_1423751 [Lentinus brumalis]|uniref:Uncharacterized protein n=1 Tax=Lentinus brumalis TaxID=2498619 RepID=A0A371CJ79_9APHY|nr:hypothetical protein OH76DRAFT_1423751 [Polyporus brumalis]